MTAVALAVLGVGAAACGPDAPAYDVDTSGGVPVVRNHRPQWDDDDGWKVSRRPELSIPQWTVGDGRDTFHLADAKRLPDGTIAVANGFSGEIGVYATSGRPLRRFGGSGLEPGTFQRLRWLHVIDGALWAFDGMGRWNVFDFAGDLIATTYLEPTGGPWYRVLPYGHEVAVLASFGFPLAFEPGRQRGEAVVLRYELTGAAIDTLAVVPGREVYAHDTGRGLSMTPMPFGALPVLHGGDRRLYYGAGDGMAIEAYREGRVADRIFMIPQFALPISDEEWERETARFVALEQRYAELDPDTPTGLAARVPRPGSRPAYERFLEDFEENLWVAMYDPDHANRGLPASDRWVVFDREGRWLGSVDTPPGLAITEIGSDYVLGIAREDDRSVVRRHTLFR
ncbi:MAG: hypothetical protein R3195_14830 [Gemmatimonadota bacterium]|nr:hypothetical protein [Gemmatimonadota bacterium]